MRRPFKRSSGPPAAAPEEMTLVEHLAELRMRIIRSLLAIVLGAVIIFVLYDPIINFLRQPYEDVCRQNPSFNCPDGFLFTTPLQGFNTRLRVSGYGGFLLALPVVLWQVWRFIVPGLEAKEKKYARPFIVATVFFFVFGAVLAYWTTEKALAWLISYGGEGTAAFTPDAYVNFLAIMMGAFGVGFLFPVLLVFLELAGVIDYRQLAGWWRFAVVIIVITAAVITPGGDPISMFVLSAAMLVFYGVSIAVGWVVFRRRARAAELAGAA